MKMTLSPQFKEKLTGKRILLGITGSIASYKSAHLVRLLIKSGAEVKVIMTSGAMDFISPLTLSTLSKNPVFHSFEKNDQGEWNNHVELGLWADLMIVAPLTANTMAKMAQGLCDNLLLAVYLSARCPVLISPAMDLDMYKHPSTKRNFLHLSNDGVTIIDAAYGELASGLSGQGRMAEPEELLEHISNYFSKNEDLKGKKALVTAGPTQEPIDPVRYISNHSSGKMGYALANELKERGCEVYLVSGPTTIPQPRVKEVIEIQTAKEMYEAAKHLFEDMDLVIFAAAVSDYKSETIAENKIKKKEDDLCLNLASTTDIAKSLGNKKKQQFNVGFALETDNELDNAKKKLNSKNLDLIVLNSLKNKDAGFGIDTNKVTIINKAGEELEFPVKAKAEVAKDIVDQIIKEFNH